MSQHSAALIAEKVRCGLCEKERGILNYDQDRYFLRLPWCR